MVSETTNYQLKKPSGDDPYNINVFNENWDVIDAKLKANADDIANNKLKVDGAASSIVNENLPANIVVVSKADGKVAPSTITVEELNALDGIKGNIDEQISALETQCADMETRLSAEETEIDSMSDTIGKAMLAMGLRLDTTQTTANGAKESADSAMSVANSALAKANTATELANAVPKITISADDPSGGEDGDLWFIYE